MPVLTDDALNKNIKSGTIYPMYLLHGEESHLLQNTLSLLLKKVVDPTFESFNFQRFEGESITFNQFQTAYEALPMMAAQKCVTVKDWNLDKLAKADYTGLTDLLTQYNPSTVLILYYTNTNIDVKKNAKFKKVCDIIGKAGAVCEFALKDKGTLKKAIASRCHKAGSEISPGACERLIEACGSSFSVLLNEVDKLIGYADGSEITEEAVNLLCIESVQNTAFDLSNAILQNNYDKAFSILDRLFYLRLEPIMVMGALNMSFIDLYRMKAAQLVGLSSDNVIADFKYKSKYRITKLYKDIGRFSPEQLRQCIKSLEKADRLLKSSRLESRMIMEQMLGEMMSFTTK